MRQPQRQYSVEDYFFVDVASPIRHEYALPLARIYKRVMFAR
jgi:hypothetical protein